MGIIWGKCCCKSGEAATEEDYYQGCSRKEAPDVIKGRVIEEAIGQENHGCSDSDDSTNYSVKASREKTPKKVRGYGKEERIRRRNYNASCFDSDYSPYSSDGASWTGDLEEDMFYRGDICQPARRLTDRGMLRYQLNSDSCFDSNYSPYPSVVASWTGDLEEDMFYRGDICQPARRLTDRGMLRYQLNSDRCCEGQFPVCDYCDEPIFKDEEKFGNCHKKPCYSNKTGKCCECNDRATKGIYCESCYDSKYQPPLRAEASWGGRNVKFYSREEPSRQMISPSMFQLGRKMPLRLTDGGPQFNTPNHNSSDSDHSPPCKAASSKKRAQKKGKAYISEKTSDELSSSSASSSDSDHSPPRKAASSKKRAQKKDKSYESSCDSKYPPPATVGISTEGPNYNLQMQFDLEWILSPVLAMGRALTSKLIGGWL